MCTPLFVENRPVWEAFDRIASFLRGVPGQIKSDASLCHIKNKSLVYIGEGCKIDAFTVIEGPCWIGDGVEVRPHAYIREGCVIGEKALIGHSSELVRTIVFPGAKIAHFNYAGDSIIGENVNLGAGVKCANLRLDEKEISFFYLGVKHETHCKKMGAVIGNRARIGCNAVLNPGTFLFPDAHILPCKEIRGVIHANEKLPAL